MNAAKSGSERRPKDQKRIPLSMRITPQVRDRLVTEAEAFGRSITHQAELRLEQSIRDEDRAELFGDLYYGRELAALLEVLGRALRDAGTHAADYAAKAGLGSPNWLENPHGFDVAIRAAARVLEALRPPGEIKVPSPRVPAEAMLGEAVANGLLNAVAHEAPGDFMEEWGAGIRARFGRLRERLVDFDYSVGAQSAVLPSPTSPGILLYDTDDKNLLEEGGPK